MMTWDIFKSILNNKDRWASGISITIAVLQIVLMIIGRDE
jgi:hypothetical protein